MVILMEDTGLGATEARGGIVGGLQRGVVKDQLVYNDAQ